MSGRRATDLTIVINCHDMRREAPRTLESLAPGYQRGTSGIEYEIVAIDNGSRLPLDPAIVRRVGGEGCRHVAVETDSASPAAAINSVVRESASEWIMCFIDGARMASPGIVRSSMACTRMFDRPFVYTLAMHLGHRLQNDALERGYDQSAEDALLDSVDWRNDGYALFRISTVSPARVRGFFSRLAETNCFLMRRDDYLAIGGMCEEFRSPGGGLVNHDLFNRVHETAGIDPVMLLGEATFHQFHGGVSTNTPRRRHPWAGFADEYRRIRGRDFSSGWRPPVYFGGIPGECSGLVHDPREVPAISRRTGWWRRCRGLFSLGQGRTASRER